MFTLYGRLHHQWVPLGRTPSAVVAVQMAPGLLVTPGVDRIELRGDDGTPLCTWEPDPISRCRVIAFPN